MTTTENTTRHSENTLTRRKMLQSVAVTSSLAIAASLTPSQRAAAMEETGQAATELLDLIRTHRSAWESFCKCINASDSLHPDYAGPEGEAIWAMRNDAEQEALQLVLAFPVRTLADAQAKATHLLDQDYGLDDDDFEELLSSIADHAPQRYASASTNVLPQHHHAIQALISELVDAIAAETKSFQTTPDNDEGEVITGAAIDRVMAAKYALLAVPKEDFSNDSRAATDMMRALALLQRRWLVMEGSYQDEDEQEECLLVDLLLQGTRFDKVPLLWHINGEPCGNRPTDAKLQAGWES